MEEKCINTITNLCFKYKDNDYILQRIDSHINTYLETTLSTEDENHKKRIIRTNTLSKEQQNFIQIFLSKNNYFYLANSNCFYEYNKKHYSVIKEDDILHKLLNNISQDRTLQDWKYKTKVNIIKQIKDRNLFTSVPESSTIQSVIKTLYPSFFSSRDMAKYFITIIGDNILKKNQDNIYLIYGKSKKLLTELENVAYITTGSTNTTRNFIKYHEQHQYSNCRLVCINDTRENNDANINLTLDFICVATHYSNRYNGADGYPSLQRQMKS